MAKAVQASYYDDIEAALTTDKKELAWFYYKEEGLDNKEYLPKKKSILNWIKIKDFKSSAKGDQSVRLAEANVDGRIKNVRNMIIDMIMSAQQKIYMEQLFIYDKYIVDALIKRKLQLKDNLEIKLLIDHNGNFGMNGLPNTIFLKEMKDAGIEIRARKLYGITAHFPNGHEQEYHQENHRKILSVDGKVLLGGSSNINPDTLQGSFREFGAQIYDPAIISSFDERLLRDWDDEELTEYLEIDNMQLKIGGKLLLPEVSALINNIAAGLIRSKDDLEKRY